MLKAVLFSVAGFEKSIGVNNPSTEISSFPLGRLAGCKHSLFGIPSSPADATPNHIVFNPKSRAERFQASCHTTNRKDQSAPSVFRLFLSGRPLAVFSKISLVGINSLQAKAVRSVTHISKKVLKLFPFFTHLDSASAVKRIVGIFWIIASLKHVCPTSVRLTSRKSMRGVFLSRVTSARPRAAMTQQETLNQCCVPAIAHTATPRLSIWKDGILKHYELAKSFPGEQYSFRHILNRLMMCNWRKLGSNLISAEYFIPMPACAANSFTY